MSILQVKSVNMSRDISVSNNHQPQYSSISFLSSYPSTIAMFELCRTDCQWPGAVMSYPSNVRQILIKRSTPQPATIKTPAGGTIATALSVHIQRDDSLRASASQETAKLQLTQNCDEDQEEGRDKTHSDSCCGLYWRRRL